MSFESPQSNDQSDNSMQLEHPPLSENSETTVKGSGSRLIGAVLSPAVQFWLRSQVTSVEKLTVNIEGRDRQLLSGTIPKVSLCARRAVYQGLHLTEAALVGTGIRVNLGQVIKGQPLRLLEPVVVAGEVSLSQTDLNASLQAPLLATALSDFLQPLLPAPLKNHPIQLQNPQINIEVDQLTLMATILDPQGSPIPLVLQSVLKLTSPHELSFENLRVQLSEISRDNLDPFQLDLGSEVALEALILRPGQILCKGEIKVIP